MGPEFVKTKTLTPIIYDIVKAFFADEGWAHQESQADTGLMLNFGGKNGVWCSCARVREDAVQLQYRTSIDVQGQVGHLTNGIIQHNVYQNMLTMDRYLPGISVVIEGRLDLAAAIALVDA